MEKGWHLVAYSDTSDMFLFAHRLPNWIGHGLNVGLVWPVNDLGWLRRRMLFLGQWLLDVKGIEYHMEYWA